MADEAQVYYFHVGARDTAGNVQWARFGPVFVDQPHTPDLIDDLDQHGWMDSGATLVSSDATEALRTSNVTSASQQLYASWNASAVRLAWVGANLNGLDDVYLYLDTQTGGAAQLYDPINNMQIMLPMGFAPDVLLWLRDTDSANLLRWNGNTWVIDRVLSAGEYRSATAMGKPVTDILFVPCHARPNQYIVAQTIGRGQ